MFDFPNAPATNQTYQGYIWDGEKWTSNATLSPPPVPPPVASTQRGYIFGLHLLYTTTTTLTVQPGMAMDSTGTVMMVLAAALTKTTAAWAAGSNAGGLDTGAIVNQTWYHWYLIYNPTTLATDVVFSATATPDAGPTVMPSGFTKYRRVFSARWTGTSIWFLVSQIGDEFIYGIANPDVNNAAQSTVARNLYVLTVPLGIIVDALLRITVAFGATNLMIATSPSENDQAPTGAGAGVTVRTTAAADAGSTATAVRTDVQGRVGLRVSVATNAYISTYGYIDRRGKDN